MSLTTKPTDLTATIDIHKPLIEQCRQGKRKAQFELYRLYAPAMFNVCMRMLNRREEAEDLLQESFTEAFANLHNFRFESGFGGWLKRIVINRCINHLKRRRVELIFDNHDYHIAEEDPTGYEEVKLEAARIMKAVERLPEGFRIVFSLYMFEGYDHTEIAEILGLSESTSKTQYMRAKAKIKELVTQELHEG